MDKTLIIIPIAIYLIAMLYIAYRVNNIKNNSKSLQMNITLVVDLWEALYLQ